MYPNHQTNPSNLDELFQSIQDDNFGYEYNIFLNILTINLLVIN